MKDSINNVSFREAVDYSKNSTSSIYIDTDSVSSEADRLEKLNQKLVDDFESIFDKMYELERTWEGNSFGNLQTSYEILRQNINQQKSDLDQQIKILRSFVINGYIDTEITNVRLSDAFE